MNQIRNLVDDPGQSLPDPSGPCVYWLQGQGIGQLSASGLIFGHQRRPMLEPKTYEATIDDRIRLPLDVTDLEDMDILPEGKNHWHLLHQGKSFHIVAEEVNYADKYFILRVNGIRHEVRLSDPYDVLINKLGLAKKVVHPVNEIKAPMPGLIREVQVVQGQSIQEGDPVLVLEAMKMENVIKSPSAGIISKVLIQSGDAVEKGAVMIVFE